MLGVLLEAVRKYGNDLVLGGYLHPHVFNILQGIKMSRYIKDHSIFYVILEKWFPLRGERAHSLKLFCMYDKRFEI